MTSARVPTRMFASCASATTLAAIDCACFGDCLRVVDLNEHGTRCDVLAAHDRDLGDAPVDTRGDVEPRRVDLALHQQRHRPYQIPDRQAGDDGDDYADNDRRNPRGRPRRFRRLAQLRELRGFRGCCLRLRFRYLRVHRIPPRSANRLSSLGQYA